MVLSCTGLLMILGPYCQTEVPCLKKIICIITSWDPAKVRGNIVKSLVPQCTILIDWTHPFCSSANSFATLPGTNEDFYTQVSFLKVLCILRINITRCGDDHVFTVASWL